MLQTYLCVCDIQYNLHNINGTKFISKCTFIIPTQFKWMFAKALGGIGIPSLKTADFVAWVLYHQYPERYRKIFDFHKITYQLNTFEILS